MSGDAAPARRASIRIRPATSSGILAVTLFFIALLLFIARLWLRPAIGMPVNYLIVLAVAASSGVIASFAVLFQRERAASVMLTMLVGDLATLWLVAEA